MFVVNTVLSPFVGTSAESSGNGVSADKKPSEEAILLAADIETEDNDIAFDEDMYNMAIVALCRDAEYLSSAGKPCESKCVRLFRLVNTAGALLLTIFFQFYILEKVRQFVTGKAVADIQKAYAHFELTMYNETFNFGGEGGCPRGVGPMQFLNFEALDLSQQEAACRIPLSQPLFLFAILFVWTLTILQNLRQITQRLNTLWCLLPTHLSWEDCLVACTATGSNVIIQGLPCGMKVFLLVFVFLPWMTVNPYLWWIGSRWLMATNNFNDLILNAIALAFVTDLKTLIYMALVSKRSKLELGSTTIRLKDRNAAIVVQDLIEANRTFIFAIVASAIVLVYMGVPRPFAINGLQKVLPGYQWDVHDVCKPWIAFTYCVGKGCPTSISDALHRLHNKTAANASVLL